MINEIAFITRPGALAFERLLKDTIKQIQTKDPYGVIKIQCFPYGNSGDGHSNGYSALIVSCDGGEPLVGARV